MKKINFFKLCLMMAVLITASTVRAQVPTHGSISVSGAEIWTRTLPVPATQEPVLTNSTLNYKVVTIGGKTWVWMQLSGGNFWGDTATEFGYTTGTDYTDIAASNTTKFTVPAANIVPGTNNRQIIGSTTTSIPSVVNLFMRPQANGLGGTGFVNGPQHTLPVAYNPATPNIAAGDVTNPVFSATPGKTITLSSITIALNATDDSGNLFYYIEHGDGSPSEVIFTNSVTYAITPTTRATYTIYAVDFSGNVSAPQTVKTIEDGAVTLATPTGLALNPDKKSLTFTAVPNASSYYLEVVDNTGALVFGQENFNSGDALKYFLAGNLTIKLMAAGNGVTSSSSEFATIAWGVDAGQLDLVTGPLYDNYFYNPEGDGGESFTGTDIDAAYFSWETDASRKIVITIKAHLLVNGTEDQTAFRGNMAIANFTVNGRPGGDYFTLGYSGKQTTLTPISGKIIPFGSAIQYSGNIPYRTTTNATISADVKTAAGITAGGSLANLYPTPKYYNGVPYIYGATIQVAEARRLDRITVTLADPTQGTVFAVGGSAAAFSVACEDQYGDPFETPADLIWKTSGNGTVAFGVYTPTAKGNVSISVSSGDITSNAISLNIITDAPNVAQGKTVTAIEGSTGLTNAVDGNEATLWQMLRPEGTTGNVYDAWMIVDLGDKYQIEMIEVVWEGASSRKFIVEYSNDGESFTEKYSEQNNTGGNGVTPRNKFYENPEATRYIRIFSTEAHTGDWGTKMRELYVYGKSIATSTGNVTDKLFSIYPNPATDVINFGSTVNEVSIYTLQGQLVLSQANVSSVTVSDLAKGMYVVRAMDNDGKQTSAKVEIK